MHNPSSVGERVGCPVEGRASDRDGRQAHLLTTDATTAGWCGTIRRLTSKPLAIVLALLSLVGAPGAWHANDDVDFEEQVLTHDHEAHRYQVHAAPVHSRSEHCALCHWLQSFRHSLVSHSRVAFAEDAHNVGQSPVATGSDKVNLYRLPTRAPPA